MRLATLSGALALVVCALVGCVGETAEDTATSDDALVGATPENNPAYGAVVAIWRTAEPRMVVGTGVLIAPNVVATAEHVIREHDGFVEVRAGYDAQFATKKSAIKRVERTTAEGTTSVVGFGADVSFLVLSKPMTNITPLPMLGRSLQTSDLGTEVRIVGYGQVRPEISASPGRVRRSAPAKITAVSGPPRANALTAPVPTTGKPLRAGYEAQVEDMDKGYNCVGDSGAPHLATIDGVLTVVALSSAQSVSGGGKTKRCTPDFTIVSSFGPEVQAAKARALAAK